jgi:hypothetical protein
LDKVCINDRPSLVRRALTVPPILGELDKLVLAPTEDSPRQKAIYADQRVQSLLSKTGASRSEPIKQPDFGIPKSSSSKQSRDRLDDSTFINDAALTSEEEDDSEDEDDESEDDEDEDDEDDDDQEDEEEDGQGSSKKLDENSSAKTKKNKKAKRTKIDYDRPFKISIGLSSDSTVEQCHDLLAQLTTRLRELEFPFSRNNQAGEVSRLSPAEVRTTCSLIFEKIFAIPGVHRVSLLIREYRESAKGDNPKSAAQRAKQVIEEEGVDPLIRKFMISYRACSVREQKRKTIMDAVDKLWNGYELYQHYLALVDADSDETNVVAYLEERNYRTRQGYGWKSCVQQYLIDTLGTTKNSFKNFLQNQELIYQIANCFGVGIIPLMPGNIVDL